MMGTGNCAPPALLQNHGDEEEDEDRGDDEVTRQMIGTDADRKNGITKKGLALLGPRGPLVLPLVRPPVPKISITFYPRGPPKRSP